MTHDPNGAPPGGVLERLTAALGAEGTRRGPPPVERWNPDYCGEIPMRIAQDGTWHYNGSPITRPALVRLFASILRRDPDGRTVLVTPVERVGIEVEDEAFLAVEMAVEGEGVTRAIAFRTNLDDVVPLDEAHPLSFERDPEGGFKPAIAVRHGLRARLTRALAYDLVELCEEREEAGERWFGLPAAGRFHRIAKSAELGAAELS
ncbi:DUF1285 domain-containing protein [Methylobacterium nonmethylotrophicum]|uniref:DUF1285 domain-containing protein n=1 Tax=Methylobacterium nonmethylotrophicum TaxID=1141884 RepID=A0A4Z0NXV7_9HYPH|nr:DUF1285 domain-containing protein [Methylobacterium nonmethylotrophicum]TGE02314.1 DUF1285 domain-containing protein [Methylobacterium nonmethylotrophicum]